MDSCNTIIILGAGRSGTSLLYKLLSLHTQAAYISNYEATLPSWIPSGYLSRLVNNSYSYKRFGWFDQKGGAYFVQRPLFKKIIPTPTEGEAIYTACGIPSVPDEGYELPIESRTCFQTRMRRILEQHGSKTLFLKRTANNRRVPQLSQALPSAKYIYIVRDGRAVAHSLIKVDWWLDSVVWWDGRSVRQMLREGVNEKDIAAKNWLYECTAIEKGVSQLDAKNVYRLKFEELLAKPKETITNLIKFSGLEVTGPYLNQIDSLELKLRREKWETAWNQTEKDQVNTIQEKMLTKLGYSVSRRTSTTTSVLWGEKQWPMTSAESFAAAPPS